MELKADFKQIFNAFFVLFAVTRIVAIISPEKMKSIDGRKIFKYSSIDTFTCFAFFISLSLMWLDKAVANNVPLLLGNVGSIMLVVHMLFYRIEVDDKHIIYGSFSKRKICISDVISIKKISNGRRVWIGLKLRAGEMICFSFHIADFDYLFSVLNEMMARNKKNLESFKR